MSHTFVSNTQPGESPIEANNEGGDVAEWAGFLLGDIVHRVENPLALVGWDGFKRSTGQAIST